MSRYSRAPRRAVVWQASYRMARREGPARQSSHLHGARSQKFRFKGSGSPWLFKRTEYMHKQVVHAPGFSHKRKYKPGLMLLQPLVLQHFQT